METDSAVFASKFISSNFMFYEDRLGTFLYWPQQLNPDKFSLTQAGFYYMGKGDVVKCFACAVQLNHWQITDTPMSEHKKWSPDCIFLNMIGYNEQSHDSEPRCLFSGLHNHR